MFNGTQKWSLHSNSGSTYHQIKNAGHQWHCYVSATFCQANCSILQFPFFILFARAYCSSLKTTGMSQSIKGTFHNEAHRSSPRQSDTLSSSSHSTNQSLTCCEKNLSLDMLMPAVFSCHSTSTKSDKLPFISL